MTTTASSIRVEKEDMERFALLLRSPLDKSPYLWKTAGKTKSGKPKGLLPRKRPMFFASSVYPVVLKSLGMDAPATSPPPVSSSPTLHQISSIENSRMTDDLMASLQRMKMSGSGVQQTPSQMLMSSLMQRTVNPDLLRAHFPPNLNHPPPLILSRLGLHDSYKTSHVETYQTDQVRYSQDESQRKAPVVHPDPQHLAKGREFVQRLIQEEARIAAGEKSCANAEKSKPPSPAQYKDSNSSDEDDEDDWEIIVSHSKNKSVNHKH